MNWNTHRVLTGALISIVTLAPARAAVEPAPLVVHEWGTFTSMQGSDGVTLEGLHHEEEPLPDFVHSQRALRQHHAPPGPPAHVPPPVFHPHHPPFHKGLDLEVRGVTQKMETPVIYFHTPRPQHVNVHVEFERGLLTQWYPRAQVTPVVADGQGPLDMNAVQSSSLTWDGDLVPSAADVPAVDASDPWAFAREVDAVPFRTTGAKDAEAEKYLFYRGLGTFTLPVTMVDQDGHAAVTNGGADALPVAFAVEVNADTARFARLGAVPAGASVAVSLEDTPLAPKGPVMEQLAAAVHADLVAQGLFADEARAMVRTWSRQWFGSPGTRILYLVPRAVIDRVLPLAIAPAPSKLVRVLLGRLEYITAATEAKVATALTDRVAADPARRAAAQETLDGLGRFLEAHLIRATARSGDPVLRRSASEVLEAANQ